MIDGRGTFHLVEARNPDTVCCESALLACALLTVGVPEHPGFAFQIFEEEINAEPVTLWRWVFADKSSALQSWTPHTAQSEFSLAMSHTMLMVNTKTARLVYGWLAWPAGSR